ncbi:hypothetical protein CMI42_04435 [Candidatus Pacearchaeota archaeon]|nr:hypothetical protein [Candidatus Pacearchaeota archaeon]|tara:strand:- start:522 stop:1184 length:663 start_codon:yes stop_codon:yes gene_type:complete
MFNSQKHVFWQALLVTILIFSIGIISGIIIENWRTNKISDLYQQSELNLLDIKLQSEIYSLGSFNCDEAVRENIEFADKIFEEAKILDRYEKASRLTDSLLVEHKKYDLLRTTLLLNSIKIKETCNNNYYEVVYFYDYNDPSLDIKAKQKVFSRLLNELKSRKGSEILLIPIAGDNEISSINLLLNQFNVKESELPVILIDRKTKVTELQTIEDLLKYFN